MAGLSESIESAVKDAGVVKEEKETTEVSAKAADLTDAEIEDAKQLFKALKEPAARKLVVETLAKNEGLLNERLAEVETKQDVKEVKDEIMEAVKEAFGDQLEFLSGPVAKALKATVGKLVDTQLAEIRGKIEQTEAAKAESDVSTALEKFFTATPEAKGLEKEMLAEMENFQPSATISAEEYFRKIYTLVAAKKPAVASEKKVTTSPLTKVAGLRTSTTTESRGGERMSLTESISKALEALDKKG